MTLIFLNRYFYPDHSATSQMLSDLAFALAGRGHRVAVITSSQRYDAADGRLPARETVAEVDIHRIWTSRFGRHNLLGRAVDYMTFYLSGAWTLLRLARPGNIIIAKTDPPMLSVVAAPIAWLRGAKLVNWLQDIFPEVAEALDVGAGRLSRSAYRVMRLFRDRSLRRAAMNVVLGSRMAERLAAFGVARERIYIISNWADGELIKPKEHSSNALRAAWGLDGKFVIGYSGNLGRAHEYTTILDAIADLEAQRVAEVAWLFIGGGALFESFKSEVRERRLTSVVFQPYQPRELLASSLSAADVHLVSLRPELEGLIVPSKFYGVAAAGRPTIFIGDKDGEIARLLTAHGCGVTVGQGEGTGLAQIVVGLARDRGRCDDMGRRARTAFEDHFGKAAAVSKWETMLSEL